MTEGRGRARAEHPVAAGICPPWPLARSQPCAGLRGLVASLLPSGEVALPEEQTARDGIACPGPALFPERDPAAG
jgi:hypothetical protein